jgi:CheY-like chemotaxis protein
MNLALNARDAMPNGGKLTLELGKVQLGEMRVEHTGVAPGEFVVLAVSDNGVGMTPEIRDRVFEPFFTTKEKGRGTGLGLAVCQGIVKQLGGHVWVYSEPGIGTTFKIYFPRVDGEETRESMRPDAQPLVGTETILLVEDEPAVRALAERSLKKRGFSVVTATNGREALDRLDGLASIALVLTDVIMPQMSGRELAQRLAARRPEIKVVFMSGYTDDTIVRHGVLEEGVWFVQKPFTPEALVRKVREALDAK